MPRKIETRRIVSGARTIKRRDPAQAAKLLWGDLFDAETVSGLGANTIYKLAHENKIRASKIGKRRLFYIPSLLAYIESQATGPGPET